MCTLPTLCDICLAVGQILVNFFMIQIHSCHYSNNFFISIFQILFFSLKGAMRHIGLKEGQTGVKVMVTDNKFKGSGLSSSSSLVVASSLIILGYKYSFLCLSVVNVL